MCLVLFVLTNGEFQIACVYILLQLLFTLQVLVFALNFIAAAAAAARRGKTLYSKVSFSVRI